jgi:hypothetical protein
LDYVGNAPELTGAAQPRQTAEFQVADGSRFGQVQSLDLDLPQKTWVTFNAVAAPTNRIYVDNAEVAEKDMFREWAKIALPLGPGKHHLEYRFEPGTFWSVLRTITEFLFFAVALVCLYLEWRSQESKMAPTPR